MILSLIFQLFLLTAAYSPDSIDIENPVVTIPVIQTNIVSAAEPEMELIEGFDERTALSFSHSLPVVSTDGNGFGPQRINTNSLGVLTTAESVVVIDRRTRKVLFEKASEEVRPIASITKLMTALTLLDQGLDFDGEITILAEDYREGGRIHVYEGETFTVQDLWMDGLIASDNVAIMALVRATGLTEGVFVKAMNDLAVELELKNSHFVEPTGINANNISTARDVAELIDRALQKDEIAEAVTKSSYSFQPLNNALTRTVVSTNELLESFVNQEPYKLNGGKTGFTYEAGYCLGVAVDGPNETDNIMVVVLGSDSAEDRFQEVKGLIDWTYENFKW